MKKILFSLLGALFTFGVAQAQTLSIDDVEVKPGETTSFELKIDVAGGQYSGFQFQMQFPATGFTLAGTTISQEWAGSTFATGDLDSEGKANASAYSSADAAIPSGERVIGSVKFTAASDLALGDYEVTIIGYDDVTQKGGFDFLDGTNYVHANNGADLTFTIHVVNMHTVYLDEESTKAPVASGEDVIVNMKRTINANTWSTICLPFAISESQMAAVFGEGVKLADFIGYDYVEDADKISVGFESVNAIEANHPYIIKVTQPVTNFVLEGVTVDPSKELTNAAVTRTKKQWSEMTGFYTANTTLEENCLFLSGGKFWYATDSSKKMKGYRAYFDFYDEVEDKAASSVKMAINIDGIETSINAINNDGIQTGETYDLSGRKVSKPQQRGIYIVDGKKVAVK